MFTIFNVQYLSLVLEFLEHQNYTFSIFSHFLTHIYHCSHQHFEIIKLLFNKLYYR